MTPKEKAIKMFDKYMEITNNYYQAKESAIESANQLIKYHDYFMDYVRMDLPSNVIASIPYKFWDKVKEEIEAL